MKLFLDLDGVLADFDRGVRDLTGRDPADLPLRGMWDTLARAPDFFATLDFLPDAEALWRFCAPHDPIILSGLPQGQWAAAQKTQWVARMLGPQVRLITCMSRDKPRWSAPGHVLVDDRATTAAGWEAKGGRFLHHVSATQSIAALRELGFGG
jgi:hypothetical protein